MARQEETFGGRAIQGGRRVVEASVVVEEEMEDAEEAVPEAAGDEAQVEATADGVAVRTIAAPLVEDVEAAAEEPPQDVPAAGPARIQAAGLLARLIPLAERVARTEVEEKAVVITDAVATVSPFTVDEEVQAATKATAVVAVGPDPGPDETGRCVAPGEVPRRIRKAAGGPGENAAVDLPGQAVAAVEAARATVANEVGLAGVVVAGPVEALVEGPIPSPVLRG